MIAARVGMRLSRKQLAEAASISLSHICEIEKGRRSCSVEYLGRIADACKVPVDTLLNPELRNGTPAGGTGAAPAQGSGAAA
jgi:transcriptional regulator with XRE-family HTH domain